MTFPCAFAPGVRLRPAAAPGSAGVGAPPAAQARGGFALITVLWLVAMLSTMVALSLAGARLGYQASANRIMLTRARWAAEACAAIGQSRWGVPRFTDTTTIDLGRQTRCRWRVTDPTARLNVNTTDREILARLLGDSLARAVVAQRQRTPFASDSQFGSLGSVLTVEGPGTINANAASAAVLLALPGIDHEAVDRLHAARMLERPIRSLDALISELSPVAQAAALKHYPELARSLTFVAPQLVLITEGWIGGGDALVATIELVVVPAQGRLAVIRRRMLG